MRVVLEGYRCLYSPRIQEGFSSETGLPTNTILGNSVSGCSTQRTYRTGRLPIAKRPFAERM